MSDGKTNRICNCLRSKSSYAAFGAVDEELAQTMGATATFWCLRTMGKAGPDEHFVHVSICREGRGCWESPEAV